MIKPFVFDAPSHVQSVSDVTDACFSDYGEHITQIWCIKQLEYSWLRSPLGRYEDFWTVTLEVTRYALMTLELRSDAAISMLQGSQ